MEPSNNKVYIIEDIVFSEAMLNQNNSSYVPIKYLNVTSKNLPTGRPVISNSLIPITKYIENYLKPSAVYDDWLSSASYESHITYVAESPNLNKFFQIHFSTIENKFNKLENDVSTLNLNNIHLNSVKQKAELRINYINSMKFTDRLKFLFSKKFRQKACYDENLRM